MYQTAMSTLTGVSFSQLKFPVRLWVISVISIVW